MFADLNTFRPFKDFLYTSKKYVIHNDTAVFVYLREAICNSNLTLWLNYLLNSLLLKYSGTAVEATFRCNFRYLKPLTHLLISVGSWNVMRIA
jgi:hypothetical protein